MANETSSSEQLGGMMLITSGTSYEFRRLGVMIETVKFNAEEFNECLNRFIELNNARLRLVDFAWYNEKRRNKFRRLEIKYKKLNQNEKAEECRTMVKKCNAYIELRRYAKINRSMFYFDDENLCFFHTSSGRNDPEIQTFVVKTIDDIKIRQNKIRHNLKTYTTVIAMLNEFLNTEDFNPEDFLNTWNTFAVDLRESLKILDFTSINEPGVEELRKEKMRFVRLQDFEKAAYFRMLEKECLDLIKIKNDEKMKISEFRFDGETVSYWYLGNARNDLAIVQLLGKSSPSNPVT